MKGESRTSPSGAPRDPMDAALAVGRGFLRAGTAAARRLWLEMTGFFFAVFAVVFAAASVREYRMLHSGGTLAEVGIGMALALLFAWFSLTSFSRARRITRSASQSPQ